MNITIISYGGFDLENILINLAPNIITYYNIGVSVNATQVFVASLCISF